MARLKLPPPRIEAYEWQAVALCRGLDVNVFFHANNERGVKRVQRAENAKAICRRCPVIEQCRQHALRCEPYGVWGGMTADEREEARRTIGTSN